jgi:hypothetical protein
MTDISRSLNPVHTLTVDVLTDDVSDPYVSRTLFAVSEFANIVRAGATMISGEALLCGNLGYGLRLVSQIGGYGIRYCSIPDRKGRFSYATAQISGYQWARSNALQ